MKLLRKVIVLSIILNGRLIAQTEQVDSMQIKAIVNEWNEAQNNKNFNQLDKLYAPRVLFYCQQLPKEVCIKDKIKAIESVHNFQQKIVSNISITYFENGIAKCDFTKDVFVNNSQKNYPSYLLVKKENGSYLITGESDNVTDFNLKYNLNLGKQVSTLNSSTTSTPNLILSSNHNLLYISIGIGLLLLMILIFLFRKKSNPKIETPEQLPVVLEVPFLETPIENIVQNPSESKILTAEKTLKNLQAASYMGKQGIAATGRFLTKVLNLADSLDRKMYGSRLKYFIIGSFSVVVVAPILDIILGDTTEDLITAGSTIALLLLMLILIFAWVGSLRDDDGNWSFNRVRSRIWTYVQINCDFFVDSFKLSTKEMLYRLSTTLIIGSFCWKALQNVSVIVRKPYEFIFRTKLLSFRSFEAFTNHWTIWAGVAGVIILAVLCVINKKIFDNMIHEFLPFLASKKKDRILNSRMQITTTDHVINIKNKDQIEGMINTNNSDLINEFINSLQKWNPRGCTSEDDFQNSFHRFLKRRIPHASVEREYRLPTDTGDKRKDRKADVVIGETILVEMKSEYQTTAIDRAEGQIRTYSKLWGEKGPVFLLLCGSDYEQAKSIFTPRLQEIEKSDRKIIAFVSKSK